MTSNVIHLQPKNPNIYELFANMNGMQNDLNRDYTNSILALKSRYEWLKAAVIALTLTLIVSIGAFGWAIYEIKTKPVTVQMEDKMVDLTDLPLPPLEEIEVQ